MFAKLLKTDERKLIAIYIFTTLVLYGGFWLSYYNIKDFKVSLWVGLGIAAVGLLLLFIRKGAKKAEENQAHNKTDDAENKVTSVPSAIAKKPKKEPMFPFIPMVTIGFINLAIGFTMAAFFIASAIEPSRFFGLVLLIMLAYKILQVILSEVIKGKWLFRSFFTLCLVLEIAGLILTAVFSAKAPEVLWQIFYALVLCVFYSFGQLYMRKPHKHEFWNRVMVSYLIGFIYIFVITVILIIIVISKGEAAEGVGDLFSGISSGGEGKTKKAAKVSGKTKRLFEDVFAPEGLAALQTLQREQQDVSDTSAQNKDINDKDK